MPDRWINGLLAAPLLLSVAIGIRFLTWRRELIRRLEENSAVTDTSSSSGLRAIAPFRPGYLRTPISSGKTPEQQARLFAALLTKPGIDKVFVLGGSGGGPSALQCDSNESPPGRPGK